jgi:hypothetical protein
MTRKPMLAALALLISGTVYAGDRWDPSNATCLETWPPDMKTRPDFTCERITERLLVSLQGATRAQVIKAMKANGRPFDCKYDQLHFTSIPDGVVNFQFENDKVVHIYGWTDTSEFSWGNTIPGVPYACSDLPGSRYARCNKQKRKQNDASVSQSTATGGADRYPHRGAQSASWPGLR